VSPGRNLSPHGSMLPHRNYMRGNDNRPPSDQVFQFNQHKRGPVAGPSRLAYAGSEPSESLPVGHRRHFGSLPMDRSVSSTNIIDISPTVPSRDNGEDAEQTLVTNSVQAPERSLSLCRTITSHGQLHRHAAMRLLAHIISFI
jgi:hypothetical protein